MRAHMAAGRPNEAIAVGEAAADRLGESLELGNSHTRSIAAQGRELRGAARALVLDEEAAIRDLDWAAVRWSRLGARAGVSRCSVRVAELQLRGLGNLGEAAVRLDQARRADTEPGGEAWTRCTLLGAELLARRGEVDRARKLIDEVLEKLESRVRPPHEFVPAALLGLALAEGRNANPYLALLCTNIARVTPPAARLAALDGLERCPAQVAQSLPLAARLRTLVPSPSTDPNAFGEPASRDRALLCVRDAELDCVVGRVDAAQQTLLDVQKLLASDGLRPLLRPAILAGARSRIAEIGRRELSRDLNADTPTLLDGVSRPRGGRAPAGLRRWAPTTRSRRLDSRAVRSSRRPVARAARTDPGRARRERRKSRKGKGAQ